MFWRAEDAFNGTYLDNFPEVHYGHDIGDFRDHAKVVSNEYDRHIVLLLQSLQKVEDLRLRSDIQGSSRFIE